ncbi:TlpA family protein disulfide reductase [Tamlana sp. I1]|uniref:TlpA family protein disulfide reductase n=1 Tax=Tamlana sp. I1 TaxID=2762061 RepID=UPI00188DE692|nr:TlpA disulfide reductase family protein [Tamlana sp. I1]
MRKLIYVLSSVLVFMSCKEEAPKDYVTLSGKIENQNSDSLLVRSRTFTKKINVNQDGTFSDTLKIEDGNYTLFDGTEQTPIYLKNGYDINITLNTKEFDETITYSGVGAEASNFLAKKALMQEQLFSDYTIYDLEKSEFETKINGSLDEIRNLLANTNNLDSTFIAQQNKQIEGLNSYIFEGYNDRVYMKTVLAKGQESPKFVNFENYLGGSTSLDDLKGKYVYIDVWATWCGPCKAQIPALQEIEKAYHGKNIEFVSVSVDSAKDHDKWKAMVAEKELGGIQLFADNSFKSKFVTDYAIKGIPRFILVDPNGNIVSADAPRPSDDKLKDLFNELNI